jgi:Zn-dependent protease with chaperone function
MSVRWVEVVVLLALAWVVAVPLSVWFARVRWTAREPVAALLLWQAIGLSGGLAVLTAELTLAGTGRAGPWRDTSVAALRSPTPVGTVGAVGLALFAASALWLVGVLVTSFDRVRRSRHEHRLLLELLSQPDLAHDTHFEVIEASAPVAYSLPGRTSHVVVSSAARANLGNEQLHAVLAHECAHLRQRHSVLVQPFIAWERSLPFLASPALARRRVEQLVEMVCDDAACREAEPTALATALAVLAPSRAEVGERLDRLSATDLRRPSLRFLLMGTAILLVAVPPLTLLILSI